MFKYFDKAFFKFLFGFVCIIGFGFVVLMAIGYYEVEVQGVDASLETYVNTNS